MFDTYCNQVIQDLIAKTWECPMFHRIKVRYDQAVELERQSGDQKVVCSDFLQIIKPPVYTLEAPQATEKWFYPADNDDQTQNTEGDFTHSEQYALFQAVVGLGNDPDNFDLFLESCYKKLDEQERKVKSYAMLIYTRNVMCVRCSQSVVFDFQYQQNSFNGRVNSMLDRLEETPPRPMIFLAGYDLLYSSNLYPNQPIDAFEGMMSTGLRDKTAGSVGGYDSCAPEANPQMIYHYLISTTVEGNEIQDPSSGDDALPPMEEG